MKINILRMILILLLILTFVIIFDFSNQSSEKSSESSGKIAEIITNNIKPIRERTQIEREKIILRVESVIRKIAHFSIYTIVGVLLMSLVSTYKIDELSRISISLICGIIYATSDEIHQVFIPGRSGQISDVILDSMGVALGIFLIMFVIKIYKLIYKKIKETK